MSVYTAIALGLAMGAVFGLALEKSRVFEPGVILGQMQLRNFIMLKIFLTAVVTGLIVLAVLNGIYGVKMHPKALVWQADIVGGLLLGVGIAIAGACPGTAFAQAGAGYRDAWFTIAGGITGALVFGYAEQALRSSLLTSGLGKPTFDKLLGVPFWVLAWATAGILIAALVALELWQSWRSEVGSDVDGLRSENPASGRETSASGRSVSQSA